MAVVAGLFFVAAGLWAMAAPRSFYGSLAVFPPYNQHFLQDVGAFQIGLGVVLLLAVIWPFDAVSTTLVGVGIGSAVHVVSHVIGRDLGGNPAVDLPLLTLLTLVLLGAGAALRRDRR